MGLVGITDRSNFQLRAYQTTAGTTRSAELRPELPVYLFPQQSSQRQAQQLAYKESNTRPNADISEQQGASTFHTSPETLEDDEFGGDDFKDQEVMNAGEDLASSTSISVQSTDNAPSQRDGL